MKILGSKQYKSEDAAMTAAYTTTMRDLAYGCGTKERAYLYVNQENEIVAVVPQRDAYPADEKFEIGIFDPRG